MFKEHGSLFVVAGNKVQCVIIMDNSFIHDNCEALVIHFFATLFGSEGYGCASKLLQYIAVNYGNKSPVDVFAFIPRIKTFPRKTKKRKTSKGIEFLEHMGFNLYDHHIFVTDKDGHRRRLCKEDDDTYKVTTSHLYSLKYDAKQVINHNRMDVLFVDPDIVTLICFSLKEPEEETSPPSSNDAYAETQHCSSTEADHPHILSEEDQDVGFQWYGFNPHFGWRVFTELEFSIIAPAHLTDARDQAGVPIYIHGGHREVSENLSTWSYGHQCISLPKIDRMFRACDDDVTDGSCVWLSAAILVNTFNEVKARAMLKYMEGNKGEITWMTLYTNVGKKRKGCRHRRRESSRVRSLAHRLSKFHLGLQKVKGVDDKDRHEFLMNATDGLYVCVLLTYPNYTNTHAIGVDCNHYYKVIYDCYEQRGLQYSLENLDLCCGPKSNFHLISFIGEIVCLKHAEKGR